MVMAPTTSAARPASAGPLRVLIVDDEPLARQRLEDLLREEANVEIAGTAADGAAAVDAIRSLRPDLVFLDVQMPGRTGLDVVRDIGVQAMPATIFTTAYDRYALEAFDMAAVDYLVKPFDDERFEQAFRRARRLVELEEVSRLREQLLAVLQSGGAGAPWSTLRSCARSRSIPSSVRRRRARRNAASKRSSSNGFTR